MNLERKTEELSQLHLKTPTIHTKFMVEEQDGKCDIQEDTCAGHLDPKNEYIRHRFILEHKGIKWMPKSVEVHHQWVTWV